MKKTAVEWLVEQLTYDNGNGVRLPSFNEFADVTYICNKAKEMEKEQLEMAYYNVSWKVIKINKTEREVTKEYVSFDKYYNETYKNTDK